MKLSKIKGEVKEHDKKHFSEEKTEKAKAKTKFQKKVLQSGCLGTNHKPGVFAIVIPKIESEIGIVWNFEKIWIGVVNYAVKCLLEYVKTIQKNGWNLGQLSIFIQKSGKLIRRKWVGKWHVVQGKMDEMDWIGCSGKIFRKKFRKLDLVNW